MKLTCPSCGSDVSSHRLRPDFTSGGMECQNCGAGVRFSPPYVLIIGWGSFPILCVLLVTKGIRDGLLVSLEMVTLWFVGSIVISALLSQFKPPTLKLSPPKDDT